MNAAVPVLFPAPSVTPHLHPRAVAARYDRRTRRVRVTLNLGTEVSVPAALIQGLSGALADDLGRIDITPLGHWHKHNGEFGSRTQPRRKGGRVHTLIQARGFLPILSRNPPHEESSFCATPD